MVHWEPGIYVIECDPETPNLIAHASAGAGLIRLVEKHYTVVMTLRVLEKQALALPPRSRVQLAERIIESVGDFVDSELEVAWTGEVERRVKEIDSGAEKGIPAERVMRNARRALNEARRISSARRK